MFERFIESKPVESKEVAIKRLAREMLERFRARIRKIGKVEHVEEPVSIPGSIATEETGVAREEGLDEITSRPALSLPELKTPEQEAIEPTRQEVAQEKTDTGGYESVVTNKYFESWDELELDGNEGIRGKIRNNIIEAEKRNQQRYEDIASNFGISVEELKRRLQEKVEEMVGGAEFFRATDIGVLEKIMNIDGRWKNQFETATSEGTFNPSYRAIQEAKMFGFGEAKDLALPPYSGYDTELPKVVLEKDKDKRPIYGYFSDDEHGGINERGKIPPPTNVVQYGSINFKVKRERALKKATITFHDSLGRADMYPPTPAAKPHFTSFPIDYGARPDLENIRHSSIANWGESYTEVQYHGQLTMDDVESIHISANNARYPEGVEREMREVRRIFNVYKEQHPESNVQLIEF